jgi:hypothetical protein
LRIRQYPTLFEEDERNTMWLSNFIPGVVALPFALLVSFSEAVKLRNQKKVNLTDKYIMIASNICIVFILVDSLPSMLLKEKMRCGVSDNYNFYTNIFPGTVQRIGMVKPFLMQALMFTVDATLFKVRKQLIASQKMTKYQPSALAIGISIALIFCVPVTCYLASWLLLADPLFESYTTYRVAKGGQVYRKSLAVPNNIRYMYTSGPTYVDVVPEYFLVQLPLVAAGITCLVLSLSLLLEVRKMHAASSASQKGGSETVRRLAWSMLRFAFVAVICVVLQILSVTLYMPKSIELGKKMDDFERCAKSG